MKKGIIAVIGVLVLAGAGYFGFTSFTRTQMVDNVRTYLQNLPAGIEVKPEAIEFDPASNTLRLKDVTFSYAQGDIHLNGSAKEIRGKGLSSSALSAKPEELPLVAEELALEGIKVDFTNSGMTTGYTMASMVNKNVYLNPAMLASTWKQANQDGNYMPFLEQVMKIRVDSGESLDYVSVVTVKDAPQAALTMSMARELYSMKGNKISFSIEDFTAKGSGIDMRLKAMKARDISQPPASVLARLGSMMNVKDPTGVNEKFGEVMALLIDFYGKEPIFSSLDLEGFALSGKNLDGQAMEVSFAELKNSLSLNPLHFTSSVKGYVSSANAGIPADISDMVSVFSDIIDTTPMDSTTELIFQPAPGVSTLALSGDSAGLGAFKAKSDLVLPVASFTDLFLPENRMKLMNTALAGVEIGFDDKGMTARMIKLMGEDEDMSFDEIKTMLLEELQSEAAHSASTGAVTLQMLTEKAAEFIKAPGSFQLGFKPAQPINVLALIMDDGYLRDPGKYGITIDVKPGQPLAEPKK